jgi:hypothetical protein
MPVNKKTVVRAEASFKIGGSAQARKLRAFNLNVTAVEEGGQSQPENLAATATALAWLAGFA